MSEELLQRLLTDPAFRAAYLAGGGSPLESLGQRESRSSLAGVMLGSAVEAVALLGFADGAEAAVSTVLENHNLSFDADGLADLRAGRIDPRVISVLEHLSREHHLTISSMRSDHDRLTAGGSVSNHTYGRAVDIAAIDGVPVGPGNRVAQRLAVELSTLDPSIRPTEIGSPWSLPGPAYFTDGDHQDHLHVAFDDPPPEGQPAAPVEDDPSATEEPSDDDAPDDAQPDDGPPTTTSTDDADSDDADGGSSEDEVSDGGDADDGGSDVDSSDDADSSEGNASDGDSSDDDCSGRRRRRRGRRRGRR